MTRDEFNDTDPFAFTIATVWDRLERCGYLVAPVLESTQRLERAAGALVIG